MIGLTANAGGHFKNRATIPLAPCTVYEGEQLVNVCGVRGLISEVKVSTDIDHFPLGLEPMPYTALALMIQYLNVRQRKLGTMYYHSAW